MSVERLKTNVGFWFSVFLVVIPSAASTIISLNTDKKLPELLNEWGIPTRPVFWGYGGILAACIIWGTVSAFMGGKRRKRTAPDTEENKEEKSGSPMNAVKRLIYWEQLRSELTDIYYDLKKHKLPAVVKLVAFRRKVDSATLGLTEVEHLQIMRNLRFNNFIVAFEHALHGDKEFSEKLDEAYKLFENINELVRRMGGPTTQLDYNCPDREKAKKKES